MPVAMTAAGGVITRNQDETVSRMAADLRRMGAYGSERDAIRALFALPYGWGEIVALVDLAMLEAAAGDHEAAA